MEIKLLHLSDIHFQHYGKNDCIDYDDDLRNELEIDLGNVVQKIGAIDAILISGDIAFSSTEDEYKKASAWLDKVCELCSCKEENVLTVPGNHDINRDIGALIMSAHDKFKRLKERNEIDAELFKYLINTVDCSSLLNPLKNYTAFAQKYNAIPINGALYWEKDIVCDDIKLRIRGLNSTLISDKHDDESLSKLILGRHQTTLKREKGVIYLTLCHHPPQWLIDGKDVEIDLHARAKIQLFGHKHIFELNIDDKTIRLSAGALQPSRNEKEWEPRYNIIGVSVFTKKDVTFLKVKLWERIWDKEMEKFIYTKDNWN